MFKTGRDLGPVNIEGDVFDHILGGIQKIAKLIFFLNEFIEKKINDGSCIDRSSHSEQIHSKVAFPKFNKFF